jgi:hypothetical protein
VHDASFDASDRLLTRTDPLIESAPDMIGRYDHPFTPLTHLDARWPSLHQDDACVVHADASPDVEITSPPHAVRFGATPCTIGSSTRAMRAGCVSGHLYTRWLRLIVSPLRLGAQSLRGHECDGCVVRVDASSALAIAYPERFLASLGLLVASCECRGCVATASMPAGTKYPLSLYHVK